MNFKLRPAIILTVIGIFTVVAVVTIETKLTEMTPIVSIIDVNESNSENLETKEYSAPPEKIKKRDIDLVIKKKSVTIKASESSSAQKKMNPGNKSAALDLTKVEISALFQEALRYSKSENHAAAKPLYHTIISHRPNHQMATINLALLLKKEGECEASIELLKKAITISGVSRKGKIYALMGICHSLLEQFHLAEKQFKLAIDYRPGHALTWRRYAESLALSANPVKKVLSVFDKAIALSPNNPMPVIAKARYQISLLDYDGAIFTLKTQVKSLHSLDNKSIDIQKYLLTAYIESGKFQAGLRSLQWLENFKIAKRGPYLHAVKAYLNNNLPLALEILKKSDSREHQDLYLMASVVYQQGNLDAAEAYLDRAGVTNDNQFDSLRAKIAEKRKDWSLSVDIYKNILTRPVYRGRIYEPLILALVQRREKKEAYRYLDKAITEYPDDLTYQAQKALLDITFGESETALTALNELSQQYADNKQLMRLLALAHTHLGDIEAANANYIKLTKMKPTIDLLLEYSFFLYQQQSYDESVKQLQLLLEMEGGHADARLLLAKNQCRRGNFDQCVTEIKRVLSLNSTHQEALKLEASVNKLIIQLETISFGTTNNNE